MARWEPGARLRLVRAAIDLYAEQGYDGTTVAQIAERAGLTKTTYFRHFPDKREVLFAGQDVLCGLLAEGVAAAPGDATPLGAIGSALARAAEAFRTEQRAFGPRLRAVIAANPELREREIYKAHRLRAAMTEALDRRGVPEPAATLAAALGGEALHRAYERWTTPAETRPFATLAQEELATLRRTAATLT